MADTERPAVTEKQKYSGKSTGFTEEENNFLNYILGILSNIYGIL